MLKQERTVSIGELVPMLGRSGTTIAWWARRLRVGHRAARRAWRFTERDIEQLERAFRDGIVRKI